MSLYKYCIRFIKLIFVQKEIQRTQSTLLVVCEAQNEELTRGKALYTKIESSATTHTQQAVVNIISTQSYSMTSYSLVSRLESVW